MRQQVVRLTQDNREDFFKLHSDNNNCGRCNCVAWWVESWEGWGERTAGQNRCLREDLFDAGEYDGYLLYVDNVVAGWAQVGQRSRLEKLERQYKLSPNPDIWAITCFLIAPQFRRGGQAAFMLAEILKDLKAQGVTRVQGFPKREADLNEDDLWTGPENMYRKAGFEVVVDHPTRPIWEKKL